MINLFSCNVPVNRSHVTEAFLACMYQHGCRLNPVVRIMSKRLYRSPFHSHTPLSYLENLGMILPPNIRQMSVRSCRYNIILLNKIIEFLELNRFISKKNSTGFALQNGSRQNRQQVKCSEHIMHNVRFVAKPSILHRYPL